MSLGDYIEAEFGTIIHETRKRSIGIIDEIADILPQDSSRHYIPAPPQMSEAELIDYQLCNQKKAHIKRPLGESISADYV